MCCCLHSIRSLLCHSYFNSHSCRNAVIQYWTFTYLRLNESTKDLLYLQLIKNFRIISNVIANRVDFLFFCLEQNASRKTLTELKDFCQSIRGERGFVAAAASSGFVLSIPYTCYKVGNPYNHPSDIVIPGIGLLGGAAIGTVAVFPVQTAVACAFVGVCGISAYLGSRQPPK